MNTGIVVRRLRPADYAALGPAFNELARRAVAVNPHMAPAAVCAATELLDEADIVILAAWLSEALGHERLVGVWALRRRRDWRSGFSAVLVAPLLPLYEVSSVPVIDRDHAEDVATSLLRYLTASRDLPKTLALPLRPVDGPGFPALAEACRATGSSLRFYERWLRPVMLPAPGDDAERYLRRSLGQAYKKRMQQFRAVARHGLVTFQRLRGAAARAELNAFLALELSGWKGKAGTAIASRPRDDAYVHRLAERAAEADMLQIDTLLLDGKPIAIGLLLDCAGTRHFLKIAYDERAARHSPGRNLAIAMLRADFAGTPAVVFDSGAGEEVDPGTYPWGERRAMANALLRIGSDDRGLPEAAAFARMWLRRLRSRLRRSD